MSAFSVSLPQLQYKELSEVGFNEEVMEYLVKNEVTKDAVVLEMEKFLAQDITLEAAIGNILTDREQAKAAEVAPAVEPEIVVMPEVQESTGSEVAAE